MDTRSERGESRQRKLDFFGPDTARDAHATAMMRPPEMDEAARDAVAVLRGSGGSRVTLLYGDPGSPDDGGMSLVSVRFGPNYPLPRHSHSVDCLYYVASGSLRMGNREMREGQGFFAPADVPYGYTAGPDGVELLEFRGCSAFDSRLRESPTGWSRIIDGMMANRERWAEQMPATV